MTGPQPLVFGNLSDRGRQRGENEDYYAYLDSPAGQLFVVADGMGGEAGGKIASRLAVEKFTEFVKIRPDLAPDHLLAEALEAANQAVYSAALQDPALHGMGTTLDALLVRPDGVFWAHVGDSRIYRVSGETITQITRDQTLVQQMIEGGLLTPEEAAVHPKRHVITEALGKCPEIHPQFGAEPEPLTPGETYILCTDGLSDLVSPQEILAAVKNRDPQDACRRLIALANDRGGHDNLTVQVVLKGLPKLRQSIPRAATSKEPSGDRSWMSNPHLFAAVFSFLILAIVVVLLLLVKNYNNKVPPPSPSSEQAGEGTNSAPAATATPSTPLPSEHVTEPPPASLPGPQPEKSPPKTLSGGDQQKTSRTSAKPPRNRPSKTRAERHTSTDKVPILFPPPPDSEAQAEKKEKSPSPAEEKKAPEPLLPNPSPGGGDSGLKKDSSE